MNKTEEQQHTDLEGRLIYFLKGDSLAVKFCMDLVYIAHLWDDLIDKDKERTDQEINDAFRLALIEIPANRFFLMNQSVLTPIMLNIILKWQDSNILEKGSAHDKHMAYVHRAGITEIFNICAFLTGGVEWATEHGPDIRRLYDEKLETFMEEMNNA